MAEARVRTAYIAVTHDATPAARVRGAFLTVTHDTTPAARARAAYIAVTHDTGIQSRVRQAFIAVTHDFNVVPPVTITVAGHWNDRWILSWQAVLAASSAAIPAREGAHFEDYTRSLMIAVLVAAGGTEPNLRPNRHYYNDAVLAYLEDTVDAAGGPRRARDGAHWNDYVVQLLEDLVDAAGGTRAPRDGAHWNDYVLDLIADVVDAGGV